MKGTFDQRFEINENNGKNLLLVFLIIGTMMGIMTARALCGSWICHFIFILFTVSIDQL